MSRIQIWVDQVSALGSSNPVYEINDILDLGGRLTADQQREWLSNSKYWPGLDPKKWRARKVVGAGGNGTVGLWDYIGDEPNMPKNMVVKQSAQGSEFNRDPLEWESKLLRHITRTKTPHVVKLYKACYSDGGTGAENHLDRLPYLDGVETYQKYLEVNRMYMEYCVGGDLGNYAHITRGRIPEEQLWRMFGCLVKALSVLKSGTEYPGIQLANWRPICHFDLKPGNVLIGYKDEDEHRKLNVFKLTDFGLGTFETPEAPDWIAGTQWRATAGWMSPEQKVPHHHNRVIGTHTDVWSLGAVMYYLICFKHVPIEVNIWQYDYYKFKHLVPSGKIVDVVGTGEILKSGKYNYSKALIDAILYCLTYDPAERASIEWLMKEIQRLIKIYDRMATPLSLLADKNAPNIPPEGEALANYDATRLRRSQIFGIPDRDYRPHTFDMSPEVDDGSLLFKPHTPQPMVDRKWYPFPIRKQAQALAAQPTSPPAARKNQQHILSAANIRRNQQLHPTVKEAKAIREVQNENQRLTQRSLQQIRPNMQPPGQRHIQHAGAGSPLRRNNPNLNPPPQAQAQAQQRRQNPHPRQHAPINPTIFAPPHLRKPGVELLDPQEWAKQKRLQQSPPQPTNPPGSYLPHNPPIKIQTNDPALPQQQVRGQATQVERYRSLLSKPTAPPQPTIQQQPNQPKPRYDPRNSSLAPRYDLPPPPRKPPLAQPQPQQPKYGGQPLPRKPVPAYHPNQPIRTTPPQTLLPPPPTQPSPKSKYAYTTDRVYSSGVPIWQRVPQEQKQQQPSVVQRAKDPVKDNIENTLRYPQPILKSDTDPFAKRGMDGGNKQQQQQQQQQQPNPIALRKRPSNDKLEQPSKRSRTFK